MEFYPTGASVPQEKRTDRLHLRPLRATDVELDYEAVMSSAGMLRCWSQSDWPADVFSLAQDLADLQWHEREHLERKAFTFTVLNLKGTQCLGCAYIQPVRPEEIALCKDAAYAADVGFWVRVSELPNALDQHLLATLRDWFQAEWPFDRILFTISPQEIRQAALFAADGLERRLACTLPDGRPCWVFG
jgi:RimJ/RimL family protein N-acetyltransferase